MTPKIKNEDVLDSLAEQTKIKKDDLWSLGSGVNKKQAMSPATALKHSREFLEAAQEKGYKLKRGYSKTTTERARAIYKSAYKKAGERTEAKTAPGMKPKGQKPERISLAAPSSGAPGISANSRARASISASSAPRAVVSLSSLGTASNSPRVSLEVSK